jgi:hypothetical protein
MGRLASSPSHAYRVIYLTNRRAPDSERQSLQFDFIHNLSTGYSDNNIKSQQLDRPYLNHKAFLEKVEAHLDSKY